MAARANGRDGAATSLPGQEDGRFFLLVAPSPANGFTNECFDLIDICPVCKSSRYLNPNMRFLVNPECYHKMCESCVDRLFSTGPGPCPVAGCGRTLRKARFRKQTFESLQVEREVDIRRRVAAIFNKRQEEFQDLLSYNNYLEDVEALTFNLINKVDVETTEAKLKAYAAQNAPVISKNAALERQESVDTEASFKAQKEQARLRREGARQEELDEKRERAEGRREIFDQIASGGDPDQIARDAQKVVLKKSTARRNAPPKPQHSHKAVDNAAPPPLFEIQGLKPIVEPEPEKPYSAFDGLVFKHEYYVLQEKYEHAWLEKARIDPMITTGGYDVGEYTKRALLEAFAGMGVFVEDEIEQREGGVSKEVATEAAAAAAGGVGLAVDRDTL